MRAWCSAAILAVLVVGCKDEADRKLDPLMPMLDQMCACHDKACGDQVAATYQAWFATSAKDATAKLDERHARRLQDVVGSLELCRSRAGGPDSMLP